MKLMEDTWKGIATTGEEGKESIDAAGLWTFQEKMAEQQDVIAGGHYIVDKAAHRKVSEFVIKHFGDDGKLTMEDWKMSWGVYMESVKQKCEKKVEDGTD